MSSAKKRRACLGEHDGAAVVGLRPGAGQRPPLHGALAEANIGAVGMGQRHEGSEAGAPPLGWDALQDAEQFLEDNLKMKPYETLSQHSVPSISATNFSIQFVMIN